MDIELFESAETLGRFCRLYMNSKRDLPIRSSEMGVLIFVKQQDKPVTPLAISEFFKISKPSVTASVQALVKKGYLQKHQSLDDKRSYSICVTEAADQLINETLKVYYGLIEAMRETLGKEDFKQLMDLLQRTNMMIEGGV